MAMAKVICASFRLAVFEYSRPPSASGKSSEAIFQQSPFICTKLRGREAKVSP